MKLSRRDLAVLLPALAAAQSAVAQSKDKPTLASKAYRFEDLPVKVNGQNRSRDVFNGKNHTGFPVDIHITELGSGRRRTPRITTCTRRSSCCRPACWM